MERKSLLVPPFREWGQVLQSHISRRVAGVPFVLLIWFIWSFG